MNARQFTKEEIERLAYACKNSMADDLELKQFMEDWAGLDSIDAAEWEDWTEYGSDTLSRDIAAIFNYWDDRVDSLRLDGFFDDED